MTCYAPSPASPTPVAERLRDLLRGTADGDHDAFAELYRLTRGSVYGAAHRVLGVADLSADVTQEVYLEVWRRLARRYDQARGPVLALLVVIARRRAIDRVRQLHRVEALERRCGSHAAVHEVDLVWEAVADRADAAVLHSALGRLTPLQRDTLALVYLGGHTHAELAQRMQIPLGTAKTRVRNALIQLRVVMSTHHADAGLA